MGGIGGTPLASAALAATAPASLVGETFNPTSPGSASGACTTPDNGSFTFSTSGTAAGPYSGTYTESGSFTITNATLTGFSATFTITNATGKVSGRESLTVVNGAASCSPGAFATIAGTTTYTATINSTYQESGTATVSLGIEAGRVVPFTNTGTTIGSGATGLGAGKVSLAPIEIFTASNGVVPLCQVNNQGNQDNQGNCN
jgi:hypothetical protein